MPVTRAKWCCLEREAGAEDEVEVEGLGSIKGAESKDSSNNYNNNNNNREKTPLAERVVVAKAIARSLGGKGEEEAEARPEVGLSSNR